MVLHYKIGPDFAINTVKFLFPLLALGYMIISLFVTWEYIDHPRFSDINRVVARRGQWRLKEFCFCFVVGHF